MNKKKPSVFTSWIFDSYTCSVEGLALFRIFTAIFLLLFMLPSAGVYEFLSTLPNDFFAPPPGPMMFFEGFPSKAVFWVLHGLLITALIFLLAGFKTKIASIFVGILLLCIKGFMYSLGKIDHDLILVIVPLVMAFSRWGYEYSIDHYRSNSVDGKAESWPLVLLALILGFMMFTAGFPKILGGWFDINTQAVRGHFFNEYFINGRQDLLSGWAFGINATVWELFDYLTVLFEVGFLAAILKPKSTRIFICLAVVFHFCTMMILNIAFLPNFLIYAVFINWNFVNKSLKRYGSNLPPIIVIAIMGIIYCLIQVLSNFINFQSDLRIAALVLVSFGLIIALYYLSKQMIQFLKSRSAE